MIGWKESELFGIKAGKAKHPEAMQAEAALVEGLARKMTKEELLALHPSPGLHKFSKEMLVMRAITLHMAAWEMA